MLTNYHTHTTYCDGENTPEEIIRKAIGEGLSAIGLSGHGFTPYDLRYCMQDTEGYIAEIAALKRKYAGEIEIYCGIEEDAFAYTARDNFDYIIGSSHYLLADGQYYPIDSSCSYFKECLQVFDGDVIKLADTYYSAFTNYILKRKPDIVGHFDLITKYDESDETRFFNNPAYLKLSEEYIEKAADADVLFEVNTGAIARGIRKTPYPAENLLYILKKKDCKLILSADSHSTDTLTFAFPEIEKYLKDIGFTNVYELRNGAFQKRALR